MAIDILGASDLESIQGEKLVTMLFGYKKRLLEAARDNESERQIIFERRAEIADVFRQFGGERHQESARQFEGLGCPDDLLQFIPPKQEQKENHRTGEGLFHRPGFYVFGESVDMKQIKSIRAKNRTGLKVGNPIPLTLVELFRVRNDQRPIYIHQQVTDRLQNQIAALIHLRPNLAERLYLLCFEDEIAVIEPYASSALVTAGAKLLSERENEAIGMLGDFIYHQPKPGEIFVGRVSSVTEFGIFVEFLPGIEGFVHRSELPLATTEDGGTLFNNGEAMTVQVIEMDNHGHIKLSAKSAAQSVEDGEQPLFGGVQKPLYERRFRDIIKTHNFIE